MIESELAFNKDGEPFAVPETVKEWRARRLRGGRGAPELLYAPDGTPLTVDVEATMEELCEAVGTTGRVRLDPIDENGKIVPNVGPAYVHVTASPRNASTESVPDAPVLGATDHAIRELVRANIELARTNSELAKSVATQQPDLVLAAAEILRAADGAGLPRREGLAPPYDEDEEAVDDPVPPPKSALEILAEQLGPLLQMWGMKMGLPVPVAPPSATPAPSVSVKPTAPKKPANDIAIDSADTAAQPPASTTVQAPTVAPDPMAHLAAIQAALTPEERTFVGGVINKLSVGDLIQWRDQLAQMTVDDAVQMIRTEIEKHAKKEKAS
jgi:hypothetical protein